MPKTIFLTGLPRAGTTLLANILANNPTIVGGETSPLLEYIYGARANFSSTPEVKSALTDEIMEEAFLNFCRGGLNGYAEYMCNNATKNKKASIYLDKSRGWIHYAPLLWKINPKAKILLCVRDLRSVVSSFEKKWRNNPQMHDSRDQQNLQNFITVQQRVNFFLSDAPLGIAMKRFYNALETQVLNDPRVCLVRYEELASDPESVMKFIYNFLEEDYYKLDYSNIKQMTVENDRIADFGIYGDHKIRSSVEPLKVDYKQVLGDHICKSIKNDNQWFYDLLGYK